VYGGQRGSIFYLLLGDPVFVRLCSWVYPRYLSIQVDTLACRGEVALCLGRNYWGCVLSPRYARVILDRLARQGDDDTEVVFLNPQDRQHFHDQNEQLPAEQVKID